MELRMQHDAAAPDCQLEPKLALGDALGRWTKAETAFPNVLPPARTQAATTAPTERLRKGPLSAAR